MSKGLRPNTATPCFFWRALEGSYLGPLDIFVFRQSAVLFRDMLEKFHHLIQYRCLTSILQMQEMAYTADLDIVHIAEIPF